MILDGQGDYTKIFFCNNDNESAHVVLFQNHSLAVRNHINGAYIQTLWEISGISKKGKTKSLPLEIHPAYDKWFLIAYSIEDMMTFAQVIALSMIYRIFPICLNI